jgi:hypothetical protein
MNKYFAIGKGGSNYFTETTTSGTKLKSIEVSLKQQSSIEPRSVLDKVISGYGVKRSGVVVRRYGIK